MARFFVVTVNPVSGLDLARLRTLRNVYGASAHSFKHYFAAFKIIFLSLCTYYLGWMSCLISFECFQSSCEEHGTSEHYKKNLVHGRNRTTNTARPPDYKSTVLTNRLIWDWIKCPLFVSAASFQDSIPHNILYINACNICENGKMGRGT